MTITKQQWNQLNDKQKRTFQDNIGKSFTQGEYPTKDDIDSFLSPEGLGSTSSIVSLGEDETPPAIKDKNIDDLWQEVIDWFENQK